MIEVNTGEFKETSTDIMFSTAFDCCVGIYVIGKHFSSLGHINTSTSYEFDLDYGHSIKFYQAMETIKKNNDISNHVVYWGIVNGLQPYPKNNPNIIMINNSIKFLEDYFKEKNLIRMKDITSYSITIDPLKKEIKSDSEVININIKKDKSI